MLMMRFDDKIFIAKQIKLHRKKAGLTQAELAEKVDLSAQHVSRIESGNYIPSLNTFFMLVTVLNIDLRLFGFDMDKTEDSTKNKLIQEIVSSSDTKLIFYSNLINSVNQSFAQAKRNYW